MMVERWEVERRSAREVQYAPHYREPREILNARLVNKYPSGHWETMMGSRSDLITRLTRGAKRGEYGRVEDLKQFSPGMWTVEVYRLRPEPPAWRRPAIIAAGVLAALGGLFGLGWMALSAMFGAAGSVLAGKGDAVLVGFIVIVVGALALAFRRPIVEVIVRVK
jgi:hypothetical protein